jgi:hypothetical protein
MMMMTMMIMMMTAMTMMMMTMTTNLSRRFLHRVHGLVDNRHDDTRPHVLNLLASVSLHQQLQAQHWRQA